MKTPLTRSKTGVKIEAPKMLELQIPPSSLRVGPGRKTPACPKYKTRDARYKTFEHWPSQLKSKEELTDAGMCYSGAADITYCYHCKEGFMNWEANDDPWVEHAKFNPDCWFLITFKGQDFVNSIKNQQQIELPRQEQSNDVEQPSCSTWNNRDNSDPSKMQKSSTTTSEVQEEGGNLQRLSKTSTNCARDTNENSRPLETRPVVEAMGGDRINREPTTPRAQENRVYGKGTSNQESDISDQEMLFAELQYLDAVEKLDKEEKKLQQQEMQIMTSKMDIKRKRQEEYKSLLNKRRERINRKHNK